ncbi:MAG TPA: SRPBCC family protein [Acidimicrobiia bacterium]|nr:SRPBCC family protein [Acidimicrobiia bacterium]
MAVHPVRPVEVTARVGAPADLVFAFVSDTRNDPLWCDNVESVEMLAGEGIEVGARFRFHQHLDRPGGHRLQFDVDLEIVSLGEHEITWLATDRFQQREITLRVEPEGQGSTITQVTRASFHRPPGLARWLYPRLARRVFARQFRSLATRLE